MGKLKSSWQYASSNINIINTDNDIKELLKSLGSIEKPTVLGFLNAHGFNSLVDVPNFFESIKCMDILLRDGIGIELFFSLLKKESGHNMNGTDFIPLLLEQYRNKNIAILATKEPYLSRAKKILEEDYSINVVIFEDGFQDDNSYLNALVKKPVDLILLGMGMPKQERVACQLKKDLDYPVIIVCGGAIVDFLAGRFSRAPKLIRKVGMEWLYRFFHEPKRLFKRYIYGNSIFVLRALYYSLSSKNKKR